jgi:hypothetical protein
MRRRRVDLLDEHFYGFFHPVSELRLGMRGPRTPTPSGAVGWLGIGGRGGCV